MDTIRKKICLEDLRNRKASSLSFYPYGESTQTQVASKITNYGGYTSDIIGLRFTATSIKEGTTVHENTGWTWNGVTLFNGNAGIRTRDMVYRYNMVKNILREGIFLERNDECIICEDGETIESGNTYSPIISSGCVDDLIYLCTPADVSFFSQDENGVYKQFLGEAQLCERNEGKYINLIDDVITYNNYGGIDYVRQVDSVLKEGNHNYDKPFFEIPLALIQNHKDLGLMTDYEDGIEDFEYDAKKLAYDIALQNGFNIPLTPKPSTDTTIQINSKLENLRYPKYFTGDDEVLPGIFQAYEGDPLNNDKGRMFKCTFHQNPNDYYKTKVIKPIGERERTETEGKRYIDGGDLVSGIFGSSSRTEVDVESGNTGTTTITTEYYRYWTYESESYGGLICAQGENVAPKTNKYRITTIFSTIFNVLPDNNNDGDFYHFLVRYNNLESYPMLQPYVTDTAYNVSVVKSGETIETTTYMGDYIVSAYTNGDRDRIYFEYVLQGKYTISGGKIAPIGGGITCKEDYHFIPCMSAETSIDGYSAATIYYEYIDFDSDKETIYSDDFNLSRNGNTTSLQSGWVTQDIWKSGVTFDDEYGEGVTINAPVFKEEYLNSAAFASKTEINVEINRGDAAAFERHLILSECNTFEDLENYRNNFFNIE